MSRKSRRGGGVVALLQAQNKLLEERLARQDAAIAALTRVEPAVTTVLPSPTLRELEAGLAAQAQAQAGGLVKLGRRKVHVFTADLQVPDPAGDQAFGSDKIRVVLPGAQARAEVSLAKSARRELESAAPGSVERLAFDQDPNAGQGYEGVYIPKRKLVPDDICKRIAIVEDLVACIVGGRAFQMSHFGKPRPDRFSFGFIIQPTPAQLAKMSPQEREALEAKIDKAVNRLYHCGDEEGWDHSDRMTLSEWLFQSARNAVTVGRLATEIISTRDPLTDELRFRGFRPVDAGSIYRAAPQAAHATETVREQSRTLLENVKGHKFDQDRFDVKNAPGNFFERWDADEFRWVQVIESRPVQVFTDAEMRCKNLYSVLDWETNGYPVTPIDNAYVAISTRLNITTHNKNYFLHGRASRGMLVIQSEDVDEAVIKDLKQHLQANVNGVGNAWRMPVFGVGQNDKVTWCPFDQGTKDMEFQYLSDMNARALLSAFQIRNFIMYTVVGAILLVASFGTYNIISTITHEKTRDIAIMKSLGFRARTVRRIFLIEALVIGLIGFLTLVDLFATHRVVDYADVAFAPGYTDQMLENVERAAGDVIDAGAGDDGDERREHRHDARLHAARRDIDDDALEFPARNLFQHFADSLDVPVVLHRPARVGRPSRDYEVIERALAAALVALELRLRQLLFKIWRP